VKSLGPRAAGDCAAQRDDRQGSWQLELKKVRYIRSLSFRPGTTVNLLRTSIMFLMLYLIFTRRSRSGQFFSLFIYSFFIFGPLQELGNIINIYRGDRGVAEELPGHPQIRRSRGPDPVPLPELRRLVSFDGGASRTSPPRAGRSRHLLRSQSAATRLRSSAVRRRQDHAGEAAGRPVPAAGRRHPLQRHSASTVDLNQLREADRFVTQDTQLFSGTIRENLLFVNPRAPTRSASTCCARRPVTACWPRATGLDTVIGEGGVKVSGGEKQRCRSRGAAARPHLLVFDEATSSLDSLTEEEIGETIREVGQSQDVITILIAHRLSTIMHADRIHVLEQGASSSPGRTRTAGAERALLRDVAAADR
jgi:ATP-binding cassette subfamily B protein